MLWCSSQLSTFFTAFYEKIHRKSNMSFETELIAYTMLFWILRGKSGRIVALPKAKVMAFMFAISPNILPYLYRWLHARRLSLYKRVTIHSPRLDLLETLIDKNIEELEGNGNNTPLLLLSFLEGKNILKSIDGMKGKYIISSGKGNLSDLFDAFSKYALDIRGNGIIFPRRDILFEYILNRKNLEKFAPSTIRKEFGNHSELSWLFENKEPDADF